MKLIQVPYIDQTERYPTGCESISAVMLLQYLGYAITPEEFIDRCLTKADFAFHQGHLYGPHPADAFIGSPYNNDKGSYGCYAPCIAAAVERVVGQDYVVRAERGREMSWLLRYIDKDMPVIFWATLNMEPSSPGITWRLSGREGEFQWVNHQHCLLLVGYDEETYYFNDPWMNRGCIGYDRDLVERRYREMGAQAVVLEQRSEEETCMKENIEALGYPLPEDVEKLKWYGDFDGCLSLIDQRMREDIPETLREKLRMEKVQIQRMRHDYTVTPAEAEEILRMRLRDWQSGELDQLRRENVIDWVFVNGQVRYIDSFYANLIKIRPDIAARQIVPKQDGKRTEAEIRDEVIALMKRSGGARCTLTVHARMTLTVPPEQEQDRVRIWLPYPVERFQVSNLQLLSASPAYTAVAAPDTHQRTVYFEGTARDLRRVDLTYRFVNTMPYVEPDPDKVLEQQPDFDTGEQLPHIVFTPYLKALAAELAGNETNPLKKARRFYDFVTRQVKYSYMRSYISLPVIPEYCASRLRGDCGVQALTFVTLCRIAGIPARWQSGLYANENEAGCHDWAMFYVAPYGWMWADCSYGGAAWRDGALDRWNFYFCNLDPYRVPLTDAFQQEFEPAPRFLRSDPYDNQRGEAEFLDRPMDRGSWRGESETLSVELAPL